MAWPGRLMMVEMGLQEEKDGEDRERDAEGKTWKGGQEIEQHNNRRLKRP